MALPSLLSEQGLARFRTKLCERLVANGHCAFGQRCQYSHDGARTRRNPRKFAYEPRLCPSHDGDCPLGAQCPLAHSWEEVLYHPRRYKTQRCPHERCDNYYCPYAHSKSELKDGTESERYPARVRHQGRARRRGCRGGGDRAHALAAGVLPQGVPPPPEGPSPSKPLVRQEGASDWWVLDKQLRVSVLTNDAPPTVPPMPGQVLAGGRSVPGWLRPKGCPEELLCEVKLVAAGRLEHVEAARICKDLRRFLAIRGEGVQDLQRTVATVCLAQTPAPKRPVLGLAHWLREDWRRAGQVAAWAGQLLEELAQLHAEGTAHLCIAPATLLAKRNGSLGLGDFLGKIQVLSRLARGWGEEGRSPEWAMWFPAELVARVENAAGACGLDLLAVDLWQLGVALGYLLTGEHLFGDASNPVAVCGNIAMGRRVNLGLLADLPLFADLISQLTEAQPAARCSARGLLGHPVCWTLPQAAAVVGGSLAGLKGPPGLERVPALAQRGALRHLPCLAPFGGSAVPQGCCRPLLRVLQGLWLSEEGGSSGEDEEKRGASTPSTTASTASCSDSGGGSPRAALEELKEFSC